MLTRCTSLHCVKIVTTPEELFPILRRTGAHPRKHQPQEEVIVKFTKRIHEMDATYCNIL